MRLACFRVGRHGTLVGMQDTFVPQLGVPRVHERLQLHATGSHPLCQCRS